jgi:hypothetical protein
MDDGKDEKGFLIRRIRNEKISYLRESHGSGGEIRSPVSLMGKGDEGLNGFVNLFSHPVSCIQIVLRNEFPKLVNVDVRFGM